MKALPVPICGGERGYGWPMPEPGRLTQAQQLAYLDRLGISAAPKPTYDTLTLLLLTHLREVPFENLAIIANRLVSVDDRATFAKIVDERRGGWCFEINGAFAQLLEHLGFDVKRLGAAVLVDGPTKVIDHLALEVAVDGTSYLVDAGFGADAPIEPLPLAQKGPIGTRSGSFEFLDSPQGTTLAALKDGVPHALYRFKRVNHSMADFAATSQRLQADPELHWSTKPFATRLVDDDGTRITLTRGRLRTTRPGSRVDDQAIAPTEWQRVLHDRFGISEQVPPQVLEGAPD